MTTSFKQFKNKSLRDPAILAEYQALAPEYEIIQSIITHLLERGWSQSQLATAIGSRQPVISRLERGEGNTSLQTLSRIAKALGVSLQVSMK